MLTFSALFSALDSKETRRKLEGSFNLLMANDNKRMRI
jgi:hypothetical protein